MSGGGFLYLSLSLILTGLYLLLYASNNLPISLLKATDELIGPYGMAREGAAYRKAKKIDIVAAKETYYVSSGKAYTKYEDKVESDRRAAAESKRIAEIEAEIKRIAEIEAENTRTAEIEAEKRRAFEDKQSKSKETNAKAKEEFNKLPPEEQVENRKLVADEQRRKAAEEKALREKEATEKRLKTLREKEEAAKILKDLKEKEVAEQKLKAANEAEAKTDKIN